MTHAHTRRTLPHGLPAADLITANGGTLHAAPLTVRGQHAAPVRLARVAVVALAVPLLTATGVGAASAATPSPSVCFHHVDACQSPDPYVGIQYDPSVLRNGGTFTFWERVRGFEAELLDAL